MKYLSLFIGFLALGAGALRAEEGAGIYKKVLFVGDSITQHAPKAELEWSGNWGMAASAEEKDYVHLFLARLTQSQGGVAPEVWVAAEGGGKIGGKLTLAPRLTAFGADLAIVQLGENDNTDVTEEGFQKPYEQVLEAIRAGNPKARILCAGVWSPPNGSPEKDAMIRAACRKYGASFADLHSANADPANTAGAQKLYTHAGVTWHPGDPGMAAYAEALWSALSSPPASKPVAESLPAVQPILVEETWGNPLRLSWSPPPPIGDEGGRPVAKIVSEDPARNLMYSAPLDAALFHGRAIKVRTRVRGEAVSERSKAWLGIKLTLRIQNAEGQINYPQFKLPTGTFDWMDVEWTVRVPDNAVALDLNIGLEQVSGTVWFDALRVSAE